MEKSPFIPGARVAISERYGDGVTEDIVDKTYKSGNFTLQGSKQQWKPWEATWSGASKWSAVETGSGYSRRRLDLWDAETDKEITERLEAHKARIKWRELRSKVDAVKEPTMALCVALEAVLAAVTNG